MGQLTDSVRDMHSSTGLLDEVKDSSNSLEDVDNELVDLINKHTCGSVYMCGNSMLLDRLHIKRDLPKLHERLHYRMIDYTSLFMVYLMSNRKVQRVSIKGPLHRAENDAMLCLERARIYKKDY